MTTAILILENIWWDLNDENGNQASVLPFFEGLSRLNEDVQVYYMTFTNATGFKESLAHLLTAPQDRLLIYVASHGHGSNLGGANFANIRNIIHQKLHTQNPKKVEGIIFGACEIGQNDFAPLFQATHLVWTLAYKNIVDWMSSTIIDLNFSSTMLKLDKDGLNKHDSIIECAASALSLFNPNQKLGWSKNAYEKNEKPDRDIKEIINFRVKPHGKGNILKDNTQELIKKTWQ